ncbi:MAG: hypothetical protein JWM95_2788 [Gemmatimonadetes bacterium]|nr:hypothetical protein [Gemmatimonadota bacterium]
MQKTGDFVSHSMKVAKYVALLSLMGCASDLAGPSTDGEATFSVGPNTQQANATHASKHTWHNTKNGRTLTIDEATGILSNDIGRSRRLPVKTVAQLVEIFDGVEKTDAFLTAWNSKNAPCADRARLLASQGRRARLTKVAAPKEPKVAGTLVAEGRLDALSPTSPRSTASMLSTGPVDLLAGDVGPDYCTAIELAIYTGDQQYSSLYQSWLGEISDFNRDIEEYISAIQLAWAAVTQVRVELDYLAAQYSLFGCWHQYMTEPVGGPGMPTGPYSGGGGVVCTGQWYQIVEVWDDGLWQLVGDPFYEESCSSYP